jgi:hypothetical protein
VPGLAQERGRVVTAPGRERQREGREMPAEALGHRAAQVGREEPERPRATVAIRPARVRGQARPRGAEGARDHGLARRAARLPEPGAHRVGRLRVAHALGAPRAQELDGRHRHARVAVGIVHPHALALDAQHHHEVIAARELRVLRHVAERAHVERTREHRAARGRLAEPGQRRLRGAVALLAALPAERVERRGEPPVRVGQRRAEVHEQVAAHPEVIGPEGHGGQALEEAGLGQFGGRGPRLAQRHVEAVGVAVGRVAGVANGHGEPTRWATQWTAATGTPAWVETSTS